MSEKKSTFAAIFHYNGLQMTLQHNSFSPCKAGNRLYRKFPLIVFQLVILFFTTHAYAKEITPKAALDIAKRYIKIDHKALRAVPTRATRFHVSTPYYIYNDTHGNGFVIVSGNDAMGEVLAYSRNGSLDTTRLNPEARFLLQHYQQVYDQLKLHPVAKTRALATRSAGDEVRPLLKSHWGQSYPYNKQSGFVTGCVATAMAQIMYFHQWPKRGKGQNTYKLKYDNTQRSTDFSQSEYNWGQMLPDYRSGKYNDTQADAVAKLMNDVGISVHMQYTPYASSSSNYAAEQALRTNFDYDVAMVAKQDEGSSNFLEIIQNELRKGFPLYISGNASNNASGHAWVADGFDRNGMVHMNFGWDGQADGYYSLSALNVANSGKEFNGRALTFGRQLVVIAAHPKKDGTAPIDEQLRGNAPNLAFNLEGDMHFVGNPPTNTTTESHVVYHHFINQSNNPFCGDFGIGIYAADGSLVQACPTEYHSKGGYTFSKFAGYDGKMSPSGLMVDNVDIKLDFTKLSDGVYTLLPIAAARNSNGTFGAWTKMKKTPRIVLEIKAGKITYRELPSKEHPFQLAAVPTFDKKLYAGESNMARLALRKLNGQIFYGVVKLEFLDSDKHTIATFKTPNSVEFEEFATTYVKLPFQLGEEMRAGTYSLRVTVIKDYTYKESVVLNFNRQEATVVKVENRDVSREPLRQVMGFVQDNSGSSIPNEHIDVSYYTPFKVGCVAYRRENVDYNGPVTLCLIDTYDARRIPLSTYPATMTLNADNESATILSGWLRKSDLKIINNRSYQLALMGEVDGKEINLWPEAGSPFFVSIINGPYNSYPDNETNGINDVTQKASVQFADGQLEVKQKGLQRVSVYSLNGMTVANKAVQGQDYIAIPLPRATYIVKITTQNGSFTKVIR